MVFYLQRTVLHPGKRDRIANFLASRLPKPIPVPADEHVPEKAETLDREGFVMLPELLTAQQIDEVKDFLRGQPCFDRWRKDQGSFVVEKAPESCHVADYLQPVILQCPHLFELANDPRVLAVVQRVLGCRPTLSQMNLWWSLAGHDNPEQAEFYHRDVDEWRFIKLFMYLTDVTETSGPHTFMRGTHRQPKLLPIRRYQDEEVHDAFGADKEIVFTGKAGTAFLENTFGFHKGRMPVTGTRLIFSAQYSLLPIGINSYEPSPMLEKNAGFDRYINRLYSKQR
jgi:hypothetical protein